MTRIFSNYVRMILTFSIGIFILKRLLSTDARLFAVFTLVTVGLAVGVILKEALRIALVPVLTFDQSKSDNYPLVKRFRQTNTIAYYSIFIFLTVSLFLASLFGAFSLSEIYMYQFSYFVLLRALGYAFIILAIPYLNLFAYHKKMVKYNVWLVTERVADLATVEAIIYYLKINGEGYELIFGGITYAVLMIVAYFALILVAMKEFGKIYLPATKKLDNNIRTFILRNLKGSGILVITMAMYFRLSLLLVNAFFGETFGVIYAIAVQVASYLRQAVMGLVTGIDSLFSREYTTNLSASDITKLNMHVERTSILLFLISMIIYLYAPNVLELLNASSAGDKSDLITLTRLFIIGVLLRASSEVWMQLLGGLGKVSEYSSVLFVVAIASPIAILAIHLIGASDPYVPIGVMFVTSMLISHLLVVPTVLSKQLGINNFPLIIRPVITSALFISPSLIYWALDGNTVNSIILAFTGSIVWFFLTKHQLNP